MPIGSALGLVAIPLCNNNKGSALGPAAIPLWNNNKEYRGALAQTTGPCNNLWRRGSLYTQAFPRQWPRCVGLIGGSESQEQIIRNLNNSFFTNIWGRDFYGFPVDVLWISHGFPNQHIIFVEIFDYLQLCSCATTNGDVLFLS